MHLGCCCCIHVVETLSGLFSCRNLLQNWWQLYSSALGRASPVLLANQSEIFCCRIFQLLKRFTSPGKWKWKCACHHCESTMRHNSNCVLRLYCTCIFSVNVCVCVCMCVCVCVTAYNSADLINIRTAKHFETCVLTVLNGLNQYPSLADWPELICLCLGHWT